MNHMLKESGNLFREALKFHQSGNLSAAEPLYNMILEEEPDNIDAMFLLGTLNLQRGNLDSASVFLKKTIALKPDHAAAYNNLGNLYQEQDNLSNAVECYKKVRELDPYHAEACYNLGNALRNSRRPDEAMESYRRSIMINPDDAEVYYKLGNTLKELGNLEEAIENYRKTITFKPDHVSAHNNLTFVLQELGRLDEATVCYKYAIKCNPDYAEFHYNLGTVLQEQGRLNEAAVSYRHATVLKPDYAEAHNNIGTVLQEQGELNEAIACYRRATVLKPDYAEAHNNIGTVLQEQGDSDEALSCYLNALRLKTDYADALVNMGDVYRDQGKLDKALSSYQNALRLRSNPGIEIKASLLLPVINESMKSIKQCRENIIEQIELIKTKGLTLKDPHKQIGAVNFYLAYQGLNDKEIQERMASFYIRVCPDLVWTSPSVNTQRHANGRIKIGIISSFLYNHTIGKLNYGVIKNLSREKFRITLFRFPGGKGDFLSKAINNAADEVVIVPANFRQARQKIADHSLDILFYLDIGMDPLTYFLAFSRLAPVQCVTWGHPVTTGIPNMDYFISSGNAEPPGAENHYSEQLVLPDRLTTYYYRPEITEKPLSRQHFELSEDHHLYVCPQTLFKFHPDFDAVLGTILRQDDRGLLILIEGKHPHWKKLLWNRFSRAFPDTVDRVRFLPTMPTKDYLSLLRTADVILDTPYFGGGSTSLESFACGMPIVTWPGKFMRDRLTLALYKQMDIMDCVADSAQSYLTIAFRLANDKSWRNEIREKIRAKADCLYEDIEAVHELERFFEKAVQEVYDHHLRTESRSSGNYE